MLIVVGSYNQDLVWRTPRFPKAGETRTGLFSQGPGGKGFNQAMAAHQLSGHALFIAAIGDDTRPLFTAQTVSHVKTKKLKRDGRRHGMRNQARRRVV